MKRNLLIIALVLLIALPVFGLAAETAVATTDETQTTQPIPYGRQYGHRWNQAPAEEIEEQTAPVTSYGRRFNQAPAAPVDGQNSNVAPYGRRFNQAPAPAVPNGRGFSRWNKGTAQGAEQYRFADENKDGICDICGKEQGKNPDAPGFTDENKDGVCDYFGTSQQHQGQAQMQSMRCGRGQKGPQPGQQSFGGGRHRR